MGILFRPEVEIQFVQPDIREEGATTRRRERISFLSGGGERGSTKFAGKRAKYTRQFRRQNPCERNCETGTSPHAVGLIFKICLYTRGGGGRRVSQALFGISRALYTYFYYSSSFTFSSIIMKVYSIHIPWKVNRLGIRVAILQTIQGVL